MSRGIRGGRGGGRGGRRGFGATNLPPMGLTFADIQTMSRDATEMYPARELPLLTDFSEEERKICQLQTDYATRVRSSSYYLVEITKSTDLPRYSDKYRTFAASQPPLRKRDFHQPFFPTEIFEDYFNPKRRRKVSKKTSSSKNVNLDEMLDDQEEDKSVEDRSEEGSQAADEDYDVDEEYDNDYANNYFDNGEGDDVDDLGDGGGGDVGADYD